MGGEIRLNSNAFANLTQRALQRSQTNALRAMVPDLDPTENRSPRGSIDLGNGFRLLQAMDTASRIVRETEAQAIRAYLLHIGGPVPEGDNIHMTRWARLSLPNGQIAWSAWKECAKLLNKVRMEWHATSRGVLQSRTFAVGSVTV